MEARRNSGSYPHAPPPPNRAPPQNYHPQQSASYRRYPKQPAGYAPQAGYTEPYADEPPYQQPYPAAPVQNGSSRSNSHRRRSSQPYPSAGNEQYANLPAAPEAPRGPPVSFKEPYMGSFAAPARSRSYKRYEPKPAVRIDTQPQVMPSSSQVPPPRPHDASGNVASPISPISPEGHERRRSSAGTTGIQRSKGSVSHRSPLQKLEGALDDISKEERRARLEEMEARAQENVATRRASEQHTPTTSGQPRRVSGPAHPGPGPQRSSGNKRNVSMPTTGLLDSRRPERGSIDFGQPWQPEQQQQFGSVGTRSNSQRKSRVPQYDGPTDPRMTRGGQGYSGGAGPSVSFRDRSAQNEGGNVRQEPRSMGNGTAMATGAGLGLSGMADQSEYEQYQDTVDRSSSRRLQKRMQPEMQQVTGGRDNGRMSDENRQLQSDRTGHAPGARVASKFQEPDPFPIEAARNRHASVPKYEIPPQTANGQRMQDQVGFNKEDPVRMAPSTQADRHHHLPNLFHRNQHDERRYMVPKPLDDWKSAGMATLTLDDLEIEAAENEGEPKQAWWERGGSQRRRGSQPVASSQYDGGYEEQTGQTHFTPPLYLKCGPLLRYTGMKKESRMGRSDKWIWRGSVMIVTIDQHSSYEKPPTLRLFVQPKDLLPPPPSQLDESTGQKLASEYVDPLAGEVKMSRTGKTLYVRPVEDLEEQVDLSRREDDTGLFEESRSAPNSKSRIWMKNGEKSGKYREVKGARLHAERGVTFWRFNLEVELGNNQARLAYRINRGPAIGFWVPARGETMNIMFHSCNGFSLSVDPNQFCGPDPLWRDVLNNHQTRPFHVMIGGGDQIYNDALTKQTNLLQEWLATKNPTHKHEAEFTAEMQDELEEFYLNRYAMWFSQGFFGMANSQIPMINVWDDHDIIDGYGSYPHHFMKNAVFCGLGAVAFKYYMLFQHQSVPDETEIHEPSWLLGEAPGPYINQLSRNIFMFLGKNVAFVGLDCRTERMRDEILSEATYYRIFERCRKEIVKGETRHLIVLLGVPIAYPRLNFLENVLTSRVMDPIKALGRTGMLGGFVNKFDGGVEILDDLDDHWTAKHHKAERNWFIQELQELAADRSVRITILGGDVHLAAVGQFYSNKKLGIPKDRDHRYMPNVISSAIVNTPPPELMADILNKRNKVHHLDDETDEDVIPMFTHDVDGKPRNNHHLLPRRNWCSMREYNPGSTPPPTPPTRTPSPGESAPPGKLTRTLSLTRNDFKPGNLVRRLSNRGAGPPPAFYNSTRDSPQVGRRASSTDAIPSRPNNNSSSYFPKTGTASRAAAQPNTSTTPPVEYGTGPVVHHAPAADPPRPNPFHRRPTGLSIKAARKGGAFDPDEGLDDSNPNTGAVNLEHGLDIVLNLEVSQKDPAGITTPYRLLVPALYYLGPPDENTARKKSTGGLKGLLGLGKKGKGRGKERGVEEAFDSRTPSPTTSSPEILAREGRDRVGMGAFDADAQGYAQGYDASGAPQSQQAPLQYSQPPAQPERGGRRSMDTRYAEPSPPVRGGGRDRYADEYGDDDVDYRSEGSESFRSYGEKPVKKKQTWKIWR